MLQDQNVLLDARVGLVRSTVPSDELPVSALPLNSLALRALKLNAWMPPFLIVSPLAIERRFKKGLLDRLALFFQEFDGRSFDVVSDDYWEKGLNTVAEVIKVSGRLEEGFIVIAMPSPVFAAGTVCKEANWLSVTQESNSAKASVSVDGESVKLVDAQNKGSALSFSLLSELAAVARQIQDVCEMELASFEFVVDSENVVFVIRTHMRS